jgi:hypothetical protein
MTQNEQIKAHLLEGKSLTGLQALYQFGSMRLGARIYELKQQGMNIQSTFIEVNGKHIVKYSLKYTN